mgnify:CR=1 FL=1
MSRDAVIVAQTCAKCAAMYLGAKHAADGSTLTADSLREAVRLFADAIDTQATLQAMQQEATQKAVAMTTAAGMPTVPASPLDMALAPGAGIAPPAPAQPANSWLPAGAEKHTHKGVSITVEQVDHKVTASGKPWIELHAQGEKFAVWGAENLAKAAQLQPGSVVSGNVQAKAGNYDNVLLTLYPNWGGAA